jgi:hypothetical protein
MIELDSEITDSPLQTEVATCVGILVNPVDFHSMRRLTSFPFDDYGTYLHHIEALLRTNAAQGRHTIVAFFDPEDYADFCGKRSLDPADTANRAYYTVTEAASAAHVVYDGQDLEKLRRALTDLAIDNATWEFASSFLRSLGNCDDCGHAIGHVAHATARRVLAALLSQAEANSTIRLVCSVVIDRQSLTAQFHVGREAGDSLTGADEVEALRFATLLAVGLATGGPGGVLMRITPSGGNSPERIHGWRILHRMEPLTAGEVFDAYCTNLDTGDLIAPESGVDYCAGFDLPDDTETPAHGH